MSVRTPPPQCRLIVSLDQEVAADKLHHRWAQAPSPAVGLVSVVRQDRQTVEVSAKLPDAERTISVPSGQVGAALDTLLKCIVLHLRQRPTGLQIDVEPASSETADILILTGPGADAQQWAVKAHRALSQLEPVAQAGGLRLTVIAPRGAPTCRQGRYPTPDEDFDVKAAAGELLTMLDAEGIPRRGHRVVLIDVFDRRMRCLASEAIPGFLADLIGSLAEPPFRTPFVRFIDDPEAGWSAAGISAGLARMPTVADPLVQALVDEIRNMLFRFWFFSPGAPQPPVLKLGEDVKGDFSQWIDTWAGATRAPRGVLAQAAEQLAECMIEAEAQLQLVEAEIYRLPNPDSLGFFPPTPRKVGWLRRLLSRIWPIPRPPEDPWIDVRQRRNRLLAERSRLNQRLDQVANVRSAVLSLGGSLRERSMGASYRVISPELCREILFRCSLTPTALAKETVERLGLKQALEDSREISRLMLRLDRWVRKQLELDLQPSLVDALASLAVHAKIPSKQLSAGLTRGLRHNAAAFYCGRCCPARHQRLLLLAYPAGMESFSKSFEREWQPCEAFQWNLPELVAIELIDGIEFHHSAHEGQLPAVPVQSLQSR